MLSINKEYKMGRKKRFKNNGIL